MGDVLCERALVGGKFQFTNYRYLTVPSHDSLGFLDFESVVI